MSSLYVITQNDALLNGAIANLKIISATLPRDTANAINIKRAMDLLESVDFNGKCVSESGCSDCHCKGN